MTTRCFSVGVNAGIQTLAYIFWSVLLQLQIDEKANWWKVIAPIKLPDHLVNYKFYKTLKRIPYTWLNLSTSTQSLNISKLPSPHWKYINGGWQNSKLVKWTLNIWLNLPRDIVISKGREPKGCFGWVFNSKLGHIAQWVHNIHAATSRVENSAQGLSWQLMFAHVYPPLKLT